jgi:hypothetical protein
MMTGNRRALVAASALAALAALLRLPGLFTAFWLDEIWALANVVPLHRAYEVVTAIHHDSNHYLTSLWMYALGNGKAFAWYRMPSLLAGVAAVPLAGAVARVEREGKPVLAMLLVAVSFPLGFYSSEARGYSLAVLFALAALYCLVGFAQHGGGRLLAGYGLAASLGILAHLSFLIVLLAAFAFGLVLVGRGRLRFPVLAAVHAAPAATLLVLFALDLRHLRFGGGPHEAPSLLLARTASIAIGGPIEGSGARLFARLCALLLVAELARRIRRFWPGRASDEPEAYLWVFYAVVIALPVWLALLLDPPFLFPRYFLVSIVFALLLVASLIGSLGRGWGAAVLLALVVGANAWAWGRFASEGRGHYQEALERILLDSKPGRDVHVGSDQDFRNRMIVTFYRERMGEKAARLTYVSRSSGEVDYWIGTVPGSACEGCQLLETYPSSAMSGASWRVYRSARASER